MMVRYTAGKGGGEAEMMNRERILKRRGWTWEMWKWVVKGAI